MWGAKRKRKQPEVDPAKTERVFDVVPEACDGVEGRRDSRDCLQLRRELDPQNRAAAFLARRLGLRRRVRVNLDDRGTRVWELIDGQRTLGDIELRIRAEWSLQEAESKRATAMFIKMLMLRNLVQLRAPGAGSGGANAGLR
jgi:hypothetical protein